MGEIRGLSRDLNLVWVMRKKVRESEKVGGGVGKEGER